MNKTFSNLGAWSVVQADPRYHGFQCKLIGFVTIAYNFLKVCSSQPGTIVGRRSITRRDSVVLCSECCSDNATIGGECNAKLCGVTPRKHCSYQNIVFIVQN